MLITNSLNQEIKSYLNLLNELYSPINIINGIDNTPLNIIKPDKFMNHLLYYGEGKLTDKFYIKNVVTSPTFTKENPVYCIGDINVNDYVSTCEMYGICMKTNNEEKAFGKVISIVSNEEKNDKNNHMNIRLINVKFL